MSLTTGAGKAWFHNMTMGKYKHKEKHHLLSDKKGKKNSENQFAALIYFRLD